jgi:O-antigen/teichoic acid export membrane protein
MVLFRKIFLGFGLRFIGLASSYVFTVLMTNAYGSYGWGNFTLALTVITFIVLFVKFGFDLTLLKYTSFYIAQKELPLILPLYLKYIRILVLFGAIVSFLLFYFSNYIAFSIFGKPELSIFFKWGSLAIVPLALSIINAEGIRGFEKSSMYIFIQYVGLYFFAIILYFPLRYFFDSDQLIIVLYAFSCVLLLLISGFYWFKLNNFISKAVAKVSPEVVFNIAFPFFVTNAFIVIIDWTEILVLGFNVEQDLLGKYHQVMKISNLMMLPLMVSTTIIAPKITALYSTGKIEELKKELNSNFKMLLILSLITLSGLLFLWPVLNYIFSDQIKDMFFVFAVLVTGQFLNSLFGPKDMILQLTGHEKVYKNIIIVCALVNIVSNVVFIPIYGIWAACLINLLTKICSNILCSFYIDKYVFVKQIELQ